MKVLFLDIDGTLNGYGPDCYKRLVLDPEPVRNLNYILERVPDLRIVISSFWRHSYSLCELEQRFTMFGVRTWAGGVRRIISRTEFGHYGARRETQIWNWLAQRERQFDVEHFAVLDDWKLDVPTAVQTNQNLGLTRDDADRLIALFDVPLPLQPPSKNRTEPKPLETGSVIILGR